MDDLKQDIKDLRDGHTDIKETMARIVTNQDFFRSSMVEHYDRQGKVFERICQRLDNNDKEIRKLESIITYATGALTIVVAGFSILLGVILRKVGLS